MWEFLEGFGNEGSAIGGIVALVLLVFGPIRWLFTRKVIPKVEVANLPPPASSDDDLVKMTSKTFVDLQERLLNQARTELASAHGAERQRLEEKIEALNARLADPERALAEQQAIINNLEQQLARRGNQLGGDAVAEAKAALEAGDFAKARELFETLAAQTEPDVKAHADAAFALGQIAEAEIRWHDAAKHYATAARLTPTFATLRKASDYAERSGDARTAATFSAQLVDLSAKGDDKMQHAASLNEHAINLRASGQYSQSETLIRQALARDAATLGTAHPDYATHLSNLAGVVQAQGRYAEAETLYRQALAITEATLGTAHPDYATCLNNLAGAVRAQGRYPEAEPLCRQALAITEATLGTAHPAYATHLNNLVGVVQAQGRYPEAETLCRQALAITAATLGTAHPAYATHLNNLGVVLMQQGHYPQAAEHVRQALTILRATLGPHHPNTVQGMKNLLSLLQSHLPDDPEIPALQAALGPDSGAPNP